jgi:Ca-activated chloride channel family protein
VLAILFVLFAPVYSLASDSVGLEVGTDAQFIKAGEPGRVVIRALVRPLSESAAKRAPLAVALVIDKSGSMQSDSKMESAKLGAMEAVRTLGGRDVAAIVVYDDAASVIIPPRPAADRGTFERAISRVTASGSTALYDGVTAGARELRPFVGEGYVPRIVLLSDGLANVGPSSTNELASLGRSLAEQEMTITTIGLGLDYNEDLMTALAAQSGGNSYFARTSRMLPEIFAQDMSDAVNLTARRVRVTLTCGDGARPIRAIGRSGTLNGTSLEVGIDNLYGEEKYALFEVEADAEVESTFRAATVRVEYEDIISGRSVSREAPLELAATNDLTKIEGGRNAEIALQAEMARNAEIREEVVRLADDGRAQEASNLLKSRSDYLMQMAPALAPSQADQVKSEAGYFESLSEEMETQGSMSNESRKKNVNDAYIQKNQQSGKCCKISERA